MPAKGSSSRMKRGLVARARAISTRRRSPPDSASDGDLRRCSTRSSCSRLVSCCSISAARQRLAGCVCCSSSTARTLSSHIQLAKDRRFLRQVRQAQARALVDGHIAHRVAVDQHVPAVAAHQAHNHVKRGGFASAVGAQQAHHLTFLHRDGDVFDHLAAAVRLGQMAGLQLAGACDVSGSAQPLLSLQIQGTGRLQGLRWGGRGWWRQRWPWAPK